MNLGDDVEFYSDYHNHVIIGRLTALDASGDALVAYDWKGTTHHAIVKKTDLNKANFRPEIKDNNPNASFRKERYEE